MEKIQNFFSKMLHGKFLISKFHASLPLFLRFMERIDLKKSFVLLSIFFVTACKSFLSFHEFYFSHFASNAIVYILINFFSKFKFSPQEMI